ncbi:hypothetical protein RM545_12020 [Zunongwangia sp. F260]|uniref:Uncharacterized protein n=1 Tax=Autumnicola lenta TaxID=3075593 RepID=A0ABU3CM46_9FLAO|nr:hypothetical protein [Zunongwangia sp. F260]MDT0647418.1 hypothetical protein [Zunongwangia sp. F260]
MVTLLSFPNDSGPVYQEAIAGMFPVEPFNAFSSVFFLIFAIYFWAKSFPYYKEQKFLALSIHLLKIGFIGGTVYHATRSHEIWLILDWLPILLLCLAVSVYFIAKCAYRNMAKIDFYNYRPYSGIRNTIFAIWNVSGIHALCGNCPLTFTSYISISF